jgi:16S rRNA processing protein RimM
LHLVVGRVGRAVGLKGEVEVAIESDSPDRFAPGSTVLVREGLKPLTVRALRRQGERTIVTFAGVTDRDAAEDLKGAELVIAAADARSLGSDEYWDHDLVGCAVVTTDGEGIGRVTDVLHQPANDVLAVETPEGERLIPLVGEIVRSVDPGRTIVIDRFPGILDDDG